MSPGVNEEKQCPYQATDLKFQSEKKNQISTLISAAIERVLALRAFMLDVFIACPIQFYFPFSDFLFIASQILNLLHTLGEITLDLMDLCRREDRENQCFSMFPWFFWNYQKWKSFHLCTTTKATRH